MRTTRAIVGCLLVAASGLSATSARHVPTTTAAAQAGAPVRSPEVARDGRTTFRLRAPNAREVFVHVGGQRLGMTRADDGVWSTTTGVLTPDIYVYWFVVDGAAFPDPANPSIKTTYLGNTQSLLHVPGPVIWEPAAANRGAVAHHSFHSSVLGLERDYFVYTPPGYDPSRPAPYPVLYLLHGLTDDASAWMTIGAANVILDNLIDQHKAVPMVVVAPLAYGSADMLVGGLEHQGGDDSMPTFAKLLRREVMPQVERQYHVATTRDGRAIAGLSLGGAEAVFVGFNNLDAFAWIASFSGAFNLWPGQGGVEDPLQTFPHLFPALEATTASRLRLLWLGCGEDDFLIGVNERFEEWLESRGVRFTAAHAPGFGHAWPLWRRQFAELAAHLFR